MPEIVNYKARVEIQRIGSPAQTRRNRVIELTCAPEFHGIVTTAVLSFSTSFDAWSGPPAAGFLNDSDPLRPKVTGWFAASEFETFYEVLRSERPAFLTYVVTPIGGAKYLGSISVGTGTEPLGEGPVDTSP